MIQKYTCVPVAEYDVLIVTNGTVCQVEQALVQLNERTDNEIPLTSSIVYLDSFKDLVAHLAMNEKMELASTTVNFKGKTVFMFFNGLDYILNFLCEVIDHYSTLVAGITCDFRKARYDVLYNSYYYFDSSVVANLSPDFSSNSISDLQFTYFVSIANDILKKMSFMLHRIRGVFLDDVELVGERVYGLQALLRNFPNLERVELSSDMPLLMTDLIV